MAAFVAKPIDQLPEVPTLKDGSLIPVCQDGTAQNVTGAKLRSFAEAAAKAQTDEAAKSAKAIQDMTVEATTLDSGAEATVQKVVDESGAVKLVFGIPAGQEGGSGGESSSPAVTTIDASAWDSGILSVTYDDGTTDNLPVVFDDNGVPTSVGGVTLVFPEVS